MFILLLVISAFLTVGAFFSSDVWWLDLLSHFRLQYLGLQAFFIVLFLLVRNWLFVIITLIFAAINLLQVFPLYQKTQNIAMETAVAIGKVKLVLVSADALSSKDYRLVMDYIYQKQPHILAVTDLNKDRLGRLAEVLNQYPFRKYLTKEDGSGVGLFSQWGMELAQETYLGQKLAPSIIHEFQAFRQPFTLVLVNLSQAKDEAGFQNRNDEIKSLVSKKVQLGQNLIVLGNLNMSSWSFHFDQLIKDMDLHDSRWGFGVQGTWPANIPLLMVPIDHCLISRNFRVVQREVGPYVGTTHLPLFIEVDLLNN